MTYGGGLASGTMLKLPCVDGCKLITAEDSSGPAELLAGI